MFLRAPWREDGAPGGSGPPHPAVPLLDGQQRREDADVPRILGGLETDAQDLLFQEGKRDVGSGRDDVGMTGI
jgi:hypothetical protein